MLLELEFPDFSSDEGVFASNNMNLLLIGHVEDTIMKGQIGAFLDEGINLQVESFRKSGRRMVALSFFRLVI